MSARTPRREGDRPRRMLTDWTTSAGLGGDGLLALVAGEESTPEGIHLATLGYEVFVLGSGTDLTRVHHVDVAAEELPQQWAGRFALVVTFDPAAAGALATTLAEGGLLVVVADAGAEVDLGGLSQVLREQGPDPDAPRVERVRVVAARV